VLNKLNLNKLWGGEVVSRLAHNQDIGCSNQLPATFLKAKKEKNEHFISN